MKKEQTPIAIPSTMNREDEIVTRLESVMSDLGGVHNMISRSKMPSIEYTPLSSKFSKAKVELFKIFHDIKAGYSSSQASTEGRWGKAWNKLYQDFKKLDEYNINLREENKRYRAEVDRLTDESASSQATPKPVEGDGWIRVEDGLPAISEDPIYLVFHNPQWEGNYPITQAGFKSIDAGIWPKAIKWMPLPTPNL